MGIKLNFAQIGFTEGLLKFLQNPIFPDLSTSGKLIASGTDTIAGGGTTTAADLSKAMIEVGADAGGDIITIADGEIGQVLKVVCIDATGTTTVTPATFNGGTSVTFDALGDTVTLTMGSLGWSVTGGNSYSVI